MAPLASVDNVRYLHVYILSSLVLLLFEIFLILRFDVSSSTSRLFISSRTTEVTINHLNLARRFTIPSTSILSLVLCLRHTCNLQRPPEGKKENYELNDLQFHVDHANDVGTYP